MRMLASRRTTTPTNNRNLATHSYEILTLGPGAISQGRGEERPKGTEHLETLQGDGATGGAAMQDRVNLRRRCNLGATKECKRVSFLRFPPSRRGLRSFTSLCSHTHGKWGNIDSRGTTADRDCRGGGGRTGFYVINHGNASTVTECPAKRLVFRLGKPSFMPSDREDNLQRALRRTNIPGVHGYLD